jgi:predicted GIY-YIG superfamily endonuclease
MTPPPEGRTALYRLHDAEGALLYVGITHDPDARFAAHASDKPWWPDVARKTIEWYARREHALAAEEAAIKAKSPRHNVVHCPCPPEHVTVTLDQATVRGLAILHRQVKARVSGVPEDFPLPDLSPAGVITFLLERELRARGLFGDAPCWHDSLVGWPDGVAVQTDECNCGKAIEPDGHFIHRACRDRIRGEHDGQQSTVTAPNPLPVLGR